MVEKFPVLVKAQAENSSFQAFGAYWLLQVTLNRVVSVFSVCSPMSSG